MVAFEGPNRMDAPTSVAHFMERTISSDTKSDTISFPKVSKSTNGEKDSSSTAAQSFETRPSFVYRDDSFNESQDSKVYGDVFSSLESESGTRWKAESVQEDHKSGRDCRCTGAFTGDLAAVCCCPLFLVYLLACVCFRCPLFCASRTAKKVKSLRSTKGDVEEVEPCSVEGLEGPELKKKSNSSSASSSGPQMRVQEKLASPRSSGFEDQHSYFFPSPDLDTPGIEKPHL